MNPPTEQLIRDYLNRLSVAARGKLGFSERQSLLDRTRARIEAECGGTSGASATEVRRALAGLGDPIAIVELEHAKVSVGEAREDGGATAMQAEPDRAVNAGAAVSAAGKPSGASQPAELSAAGGCQRSKSGGPRGGPAVIVPAPRGAPEKAASLRRRTRLLRTRHQRRCIKARPPPGVPHLTTSVGSAAPRSGTGSAVVDPAVRGRTWRIGRGGSDSGGSDSGGSDAAGSDTAGFPAAPHRPLSPLGHGAPVRRSRTLGLPVLGPPLRPRLVRGVVAPVLPPRAIGARSALAH